VQHTTFDVRPFRIEETTFQRQVRRATYRYISASDDAIQLWALPEQLGLPQPIVVKAIEALADRFEIVLSNSPQGIAVRCSEAL
jgi:hypothetical protein